jgi:hypothetical protein
MVKSHPEDQEAPAYLSLSRVGRMTAGEMGLDRAELRSVDREAAATNRQVKANASEGWMILLDPVASNSWF